MINQNIRIDGIQKTLSALGKAKNKDADAIDVTLKDAAEVILTKSLIYVPVDQGDLRKSGRVEGGGKGFGAKFSVVYGGPTAPHAMIVHEDPDMVHAPPTCYKYLERAAREVRGTLAAMIKRRMEGRTLQTTPTKKTSSRGFTE